MVQNIIDEKAFELLKVRKVLKKKKTTEKMRFHNEKSWKTLFEKLLYTPVGAFERVMSIFNF